MNNSSPSISLKKLILAKESEHKAEGKILRLHFDKIQEDLKPSNIIKNGFKEVMTSDTKATVLDTVLGFTTGFIIRKFFTWKSYNPITNIAGMFLEMAVASIVTNNADRIKAVAGTMINKIK